jgi:hypothetical protein
VPLLGEMNVQIWPLKWEEGQKKMKSDKYLLLTWKRVLIIAGAWVLSALLHKAIYVLFYDSSATGVGLAANVVFILGTVVIPVYFLISLVYTLIRKMGYEKFLLLSWRTVLIIPAWILSAILHNLVYAAFYDHYTHMGGDEAVFFFLFLLVIPLYFIISLVYTVIRLVRSRIG